MQALLKKIVIGRLIAQFVAAVPGSIQNHLNVAELVRVAISAATVGGGVLGTLSYFQSHLAGIVAAPDVALASAVLVLITESYRRLSHGQVLTVQKPAAPTPPPLTL